MRRKKKGNDDVFAHHKVQSDTDKALPLWGCLLLLLSIFVCHEHLGAFVDNKHTSEAWTWKTTENFALDVQDHRINQQLSIRESIASHQSWLSGMTTALVEGNLHTTRSARERQRFWRCSLMEEVRPLVL